MDGMEKFAAIVLGLFIIGMVVMGVASIMAEKETAVACYNAAATNPSVKCGKYER